MATCLLEMKQVCVLPGTRYFKISPVMAGVNLTRSMPGVKTVMPVMVTVQEIDSAFPADYLDLILIILFPKQLSTLYNCVR